MRSKRLRDLHKILHEGRATSQKDLVAGLRAAGHEVTQATVSRDLRNMGAIKLRVGGELAYRLPDEIPRTATSDFVARSLMRTLAEFALDIRPAAALVVVGTAPGHAAAVARAIDMAALADVAGTVAGDDTVLVATVSAEIAHRLSEEWLAETPATEATRAHAGGEKE